MGGCELRTQRFKDAELGESGHSAQGSGGQPTALRECSDTKGTKVNSQDPT